MAKQTQTTTIPGMSGEEQKLFDAMMQTFMPQFFEESGFEMKEVEYQPTKRQLKAKSIISAFQARVDAMNASSDDPTVLGGKTFNPTAGDGQAALDDAARGLRELGYSDQEIGTLFIKNGQLDMSDPVASMESFLRDKEGDWDQQTKTELVRMEPKYLREMKAKHGEDSAEYTRAKAEYEARELEKMENQEEAEYLASQNMLKFLRGDISITEEQGQQIKETMAPMRSVVEAIYGTVGTPKEAWSQIGEMKAGADQTGMDINQFASAAGRDYARSGSMQESFKKVMDTNRQLMEMGFEDYKNEMTTQVMDQAASLGRDPGDAEFLNQVGQNMARELQRGHLQMAGQEAAGLMDIERSKASAHLGLAEQESNLRLRLGQGIVPEQVALSQSARQFQEAMGQQRLQNFQSGIGMSEGLRGQMWQERMAQPTTTQTTTPSFFDIFSGVGSLVMGGIGLDSKLSTNKAMADYYRNYKPTSSTGINVPWAPDS